MVVARHPTRGRGCSYLSTWVPSEDHDAPRCSKTESRQLAHNRHWHCINPFRFACTSREAVHSQKRRGKPGRLLPSELLQPAERCYPTATRTPAGGGHHRQFGIGLTPRIGSVAPRHGVFPLPLHPRAARRHPEIFIMITLPIIGRSPTAVISRARMLGFDCWPEYSERRGRGKWIHWYDKAKQKVPPRRTADNLLRIEGELSA